MKTIIFFFTIILLLFTFNVNSQVEALDTTFGGTGMVQTDFDSNIDIVNSILIQPDGKILAVGVAEVNNNFGDVAIVRYNSNGTLDEGFGQNGKVVMSIGSLSDYGTKLALQPDGKILVTGYFGITNGIIFPQDFTDSYLARLNFDGSPDTSFGDLGIVKIDYNNTENRMYDIGLQQDGKILTVQHFNSFNGGISGYLLQRYDTNGSLDSTFGNMGSITDTLTAQFDINYQIKFQSDDKFLLALHSDTDTSSHIIIKRYHLNGSVDSTFANNGSIISTFENYRDYFSSILLQQDSSILVVGYAYSLPTQQDLQTILLRYNSNGSIDSVFGDNGRVFTSRSEFANQAVFQSTNKIIIAGGSGFSVHRFDTNGSLDENFGINGHIQLNKEIGFGRTVSVSTEDKIIVAGTSAILNDDVRTVDFKLIRYLTDFSVGIIDFKNKPQYIMFYPNPVNENAIFKYTLLQAENITLSLYDGAGRLVQHFFTNYYKNAGEHQENLMINQNLPSGTYWLTLRTLHGRVSVQIFK